MSELRKTTQKILPVTKQKRTIGEYDIYPAYDLGQGRIFIGYQKLAEKISGQKTVIIDGYIGILYEDFAKKLNLALESIGIKATWWSTDAAMKEPSEIEEEVKPFLGGDDPVFGFRTSLHLSDFFNADALSRIRPSEDARMNILIGPGAALAGWDGMLLYLDIPKNEIQFRARSGQITNLGMKESMPPKKMYKRFYFVDWIVLNKHKKSLLPTIDLFVDAQREDEITWAEGDTVRNGLDEIAHNGIRVRPWFEPGAWGGQWIKEHIPELPSDVPNYAWSFEMIVPENGIIFSSDGTLLEVSFDSVMFQAGKDVVGEDCYASYGDEFPIRLDYLDNERGGNLSVQCHPQKKFIQENFGEVLTQEETYYILNTTPGSVVYLGFKEDIKPEEFEAALYHSFNTSTPLDVQKYINSEPSVQHNLYLIPPGTLHSSGKGNLVLEISTTPYIFTFKMYDWMALDLDGTPRPLNIDRAMKNLVFDRKGEKISREFVSKPSLLEKGDGWELWHLPTHPKHSYDVHRFKIKDKVTVSTDGKCHALNLVEGSSAYILTDNGKKFHLNYAESFIVPAAAQSYTIINDTDKEIMMIKAFMK